MEKQPTRANAHSRLDLRTLTTVALMTAVLCVLSPFSIPIGPVPVSLSLLAVYLTVFLLDTRSACMSIGLYILLGLVGLPVFSGFTGGPAKLFGPTGGYIIGYLPLALIAGLFFQFAKKGSRLDATSTATASTAPASSSDVLRPRATAFQLIGCVLGLIACYTLGTIWFMIVMQMSLPESLALCVYPFIAFDLVKIITACIVGNTVRHILLRSGLPLQ